MTISTLLSLSRIVLVAPIWWILTTGMANGRWWAFGLILTAMLTDFFDGYLARRLHQVTDLGKVIDPLADKIGIAVVALVLAVTGDIPWWYLGVAVLRDLLILAGGIYIKRTKNIVAQSNWPGKIAVTSIAVYLLFSLLQIPGAWTLHALALWISLVLMGYSTVVYAQRLFIGRNLARTSS